MIDPKLVITESDWDDMNPELQAKTTYRTVISMREDVINLSQKVDRLVNINSQEKPCHKMETRIEKLEKFKLIKTIATVFSGFLGGFGGSHIPK